MKSFYIKKHILTSRNVILGLIFFFVTLAVMLLTTVAITFTTMANDTLKHNLSYRTIKVDKDEDNNNSLDELYNINNIIKIEDAKYGNPIIAEVKEFDTDIEGQLSLNANILSDFKIVKGRNIENNGETICSSLFYPHGLEINKAGNVVFNKKRIMNINTILNKEFNVVSQKYDWINTNEEPETLNLKIVGFYDFNSNNTELNTCYITKDDFEKLQNPYRLATSTLQDDGTWDFNLEEYTGKILIVDKVKNVPDVLKELDKLHFNYIANYTIGREYTLLTLIAPTIISIVLIIIFIFILKSYINKKLKDNSKNYAILKSLGYSKREIIKTSTQENLIILTLSLILTLIIYPFIFNYIKYTALQEYIYDGTIIDFSIIPVILTIIIMYLIIVITNNKMLNKKLDSSISEILK